MRQYVMVVEIPDVHFDGVENIDFNDDSIENIASYVNEQLCRAAAEHGMDPIVSVRPLSEVIAA